MRHMTIQSSRVIMFSERFSASLRFAGQESGGQKVVQVRRSCKTRLSISFSMIPRAPLLCLGMLVLLKLSSTGNCVEAITFAFNGFADQSNVYNVQEDTQCWFYNADNYSMTFNPNSYQQSVAGRFLYPTPVQMTDPATKTVKSFSTTFIFSFLGYYFPGTTILMHEPGLAFIIVPDNYTIGAALNYMGILTTTTTQTQKDYASDNHTFAVELDVHQDPEFNDPNDNHICIAVASLNSTPYNTFVPFIPLYTTDTEHFQQVWIDYFQADSRVDIYHAKYGLNKPDTPLGSQVGVDLSILKEHMYLGFSSALGGVSNNAATLATIFAWSFSNDGKLAPPIKIGRDTAGPPPAPNPPPPVPPPPTPPSIGGPVPAPASPPLPSPPPSILPSPPPPKLPSPPPKSPSTPPPPSVESNPPPPGSPSPSAPPSVFSPPPGLGSGSPVKAIVGAVVGVSVLVFTGIVFIIRWEISRRMLVPAPPTVPASRKLRIFISHTGGLGGSLKNFPVRLYRELEKNPCYEVFIDRDVLRHGTPFPEEIEQRLLQTDVGMIVVTKEYFKKSWPMKELADFVDLQKKKSSKVRILPLFYELRPEEIKSLLDIKSWEKYWATMSTERHPIHVGKYREVVASLCTFTGVVYKYNDLSHDAEYINDILESMSKMYDEMITSQRLGASA